MASTSTVAQLTDTPNDHARVGTKSGVEQGSSPAGVSHIPRSLLYSEAHSDLAVLIWADYESLMAPALGGGRAPAVAGRAYVADAYGASRSAVDDARRQLLRDDVPDGAYLARSTPRGRKRTVQHMARRRPQETRAAYVPVPAWTRTLVWAGSRRPAGRISPSAWRLYASAVDRATRDSTVPAPFETTVAKLSRAAGRGSADTGRRRLAELERVGLMQVVAAPGGRLTVCPIIDPDEAADVAQAYAEHGRTVTHPPQNLALTPRKIWHSPPAKSGTPCTQPPTTHPPTTQPLTPAVGELPVVDDARTAADAAEPEDARSDSRPAETARLYRLLPERLRVHVPEHGSRRVLHAIADELEHRTVEELAERITRRGQAWAYVVEDVKDATAVAITIVRRGYDCPDIRCEDHHRLDTGQPCTHCETITAPQKPAQAPGGRSPQPHPQRPSQTPQTPYRAPRSRPLDDTAYRARAAEARAMLGESLRRQTG